VHPQLECDHPFAPGSATCRRTPGCAGQAAKQDRLPVGPREEQPLIPPPDESSERAARKAARNDQQQYGADDAANDAGGVEVEHAIVSQQSDEKAAHEGAGDTEKAGADQTHRLAPGQQGPSDETNNQTEYDEEKNAHWSLRPVSRRQRVRRARPLCLTLQVTGQRKKSASKLRAGSIRSNRAHLQGTIGAFVRDRQVPAPPRVLTVSNRRSCARLVLRR